MSEINGISPASSSYGQIASGRRINSAADDPAGLVIDEKLKSQETGLDAGAQNAKQGIDVLNIADGALGQITDSLQRIYELSVKASSGLNTGEELGAIQSEIGGILEDIEGIAKGTEYNTLKLLDGSMADMNLATNPDGTGQKIQMANATLEALGIDGYDVTGSFDIDRISSAIEKVSSSRSSLGASTNALESAYNSNRNTALNTASAESSLADLDIAKAISEQKKNETLNTYQLMMQRKKQEDEEQKRLGLLQF